VVAQLTVLKKDTLKSDNPSKERDFAATDAQSNNETPFLIQENFDKRDNFKREKVSKRDNFPCYLT
jgi:hypothetical protein